jgi:subtilisin family serine protease
VTSKRLSTILLSIILLLLAVPLAAQEGTPTSEPADVIGNVAGSIANDGTARVIVQLRAPNVSSDFSTQGHSLQVDSVQQQFTGSLPPGVQYIGQFETIPAVVTEVTNTGLQALRNNPRVESLTLDLPLEGHLSLAAPLINADDVWNNTGYTGNGTTVAVIDTGFDTDHPDLAGALIAEKCWLSNSANGVCPGTGGTTSDSAEDDEGHGTHVSGIVTSDNTSDRGIAYDANIIALKTLGSTNGGMLSDTVLALEWLYNNHGTLQTDVVNMSLGGGAFTGNCDANGSGFATVVANLNSEGVVVFASSGNDASLTTIGMPACITGVIAVGATYVQGYSSGINLGVCEDATTVVDQVSCYSNVSPELDILAPGTFILAPEMGGTSTYMAGTSMASPIAAGVAALMKEANPELTATVAEEIIEGTGVTVTDNRINQDYPRVDALAAVDASTVTGSGEFTSGSNSVAENVGTVSVPLVLNVTNGSAYLDDVTFDVAYTGDGASDLNNPPATVTFTQANGLTNGSYNANLDLSIIDDNNYTGNRIVGITLSNPTNGASLGSTTTHNLTITENDSTAVVTIEFAQTSSSVSEDAGNTVTVNLVVTGDTVTGTYGASVGYTDGAGIDGTDYSGDTTVTFDCSAGCAVGTQTTTVVTITDDTNDENQEVLDVTLSSPTGGATLGTNTTHELTILDNDTQATGTVNFDATSSSVDEFDAGTTINLSMVVVDGPPNIPGPVQLEVGYTGDGAAELTSAPGIVTFDSENEFGVGTYTATLNLTFDDDNLDNGDRNVVLTLSNPPSYVSLGTNTAHTLTIIDDETQATGTVAFDANTPTTVAEDANPGSITLPVELMVVDGPPNIPSPFDLTITYSGDGATSLNNAPTTLQFDNADGFDAGTYQADIVVSFNDDTLDNGDRDVIVTISNAPQFVTLTDDTHTFTIQDDEEQATGTVNFGSTAPIIVDEDAGSINLPVNMVVTGGPPNIPSLIDLTVTYTGTGEGELTTKPATLSFTKTGGFDGVNSPYGAILNLTFDGNDVDDDDRSVTVTLSNAPQFVTIADGEHTFTLQDNDTFGVTVDPFLDLETSEDGSTDMFSVVLESAPTDTVTITIASTDETEAVATPGTLTFDATTWNVKQTVTLTGQDDNEADGDVGYIVTLSATSNDTDYNGIAIDQVEAINFDDDIPGLSIDAPSPLTVTEAGGSITFDVALNTLPSADVIIDINSDDITEGTVNPVTLTFTSANWNSVQQVTVTGVDEAIDDDDQTFVVTFAAASSDTDYNTLSDRTYNITNTDDDDADLVVTGDASSETGEDGTSRSFALALASEPTAEVTVALSSSDTSEGVVSPATLTFTPLNWNVAQDFDVFGLDDADVDGDQTYTVTLAASSSDGKYDGLTDTTDFTNVDNDDPNTAPVAADDAYSVTVGNTLTVTAPGVLDNDTDTEDDGLIPILQTDVTQGTLALANDGSFTYTPDMSASGTDSFTYVANDGTADSNVATVTITLNTTPVNTAPVATDDSYTATVGQMLNVSMPGVLKNDTDADGNPLTATLQSDVTQGTLTLNPNGSFAYTSNRDVFGTDSFTYVANDGTADSNVATVVINLADPAGTPPRLYPYNGESLTSAIDYDTNFSFRHLDDVEWYGMWIGTADYNSQVLYQWYPATANSTGNTSGTGICDTTTMTCTIPDDAWVVGDGSYIWWMSYWGPNFQQWMTYWSDTTFSVNMTAPVSSPDPRTAPTNPTSNPDALVWERDPGVMWYQVWMGDPLTPTTIVSDWYDASEICDATTCTLDIPGVLPAGDYQWWMQAWGPGGFATWEDFGGYNFTVE